jgi:Leucine-rich repeat (LRR) protein
MGNLIFSKKEKCLISPLEEKIIKRFRYPTPLPLQMAITSSKLDLTMKGMAGMAPSETWIKWVFQWLKQNPEVKRLEVNSRMINWDADMETFFRHSSLTSFSSFQGTMTEKSITILSQSKNLKTLILPWNEMEDGHIETLVRNSTLTELNVAYNKITNRGLKILSSSRTITSLKVEGNDYSCDGFGVFVENSTLTNLSVSFDETVEEKGLSCLTKNPNLKTLNIRFANHDTKAIMEDAAQNCTLTKLNMPWMGIGSENVKILAQNRTLKVLCLEKSNVDDEGAEALANHPALTELNVNGNDITGKGFGDLLKSKTLTSLSIWKNKIGSEMGPFLVQNLTLVSLDISYHYHLDIESLRTRAKLTNLTELSIACCSVSDVVSILNGFALLKTLNVAGNNISDRDVAILMENRSLTSLDMSQNGIGKNSIESLLTNPSFTYLNISNNPGSCYADEPLQKVMNRKVTHIKEYPKLRTLPLFPSHFPLELEKLILDYCEPSPFVCWNMYDRLRS